MAEQTPVVEMRLSSLAQALYDADKIGKAVDGGILTGGFVETPRGANIAEVGQNAVSKLESLPEGHPDRKRFDLDRMKRGIDYLAKGTVVIVPSRSDTEAPVKGEYQVTIYDA